METGYRTQRSGNTAGTGYSGNGIQRERSKVTVQTKWRQQAACKGLDTEIFFPASDDAAGPAKLVCATCPVREECLEWALATRQDDGIWGGLTDNERRRLRRRRRDAARRAATAA